MTKERLQEMIDKLNERHDLHLLPLEMMRVLEVAQWAVVNAKPALEWVMKPGHDEPDDYTRLACAQHRANEALEKFPSKELV